MSRDDVKEHIADELRKDNLYSGNERSRSDDSNEVESSEVALCVLRCTECEDVNGREPRPVNCPDVMETCESCDEFIPHEVVPDSETTRVGKSGHKQ